MVGGHLHNVGWWDVTRDHIENSPFKSAGRPMEGIRLCYIPIDNSAFEFYPVTKGFTGALGVKTRRDTFGDANQDYYPVTQF